jgi:hypothetical protein
MGDKKEEEIKIPVFTVIKNGAILKNIFIVNKPPSPSISQDYEETLIVGRHPDCDITLTHPSISRFHLQIHSNPSNQHVSLIDLSSGILFFFFWFFYLGYWVLEILMGFLALLQCMGLGFRRRSLSQGCAWN